VPIVDPHATDADGNTPLAIALKNGHPDYSIVVILKQSQPDVKLKIYMTDKRLEDLDDRKKQKVFFYSMVLL
jgi:ankyrin repeat protein